MSKGRLKGEELQSWKQALHVQYAVSWLGVLLLWCCAQLPYQYLRKLGEALGAVLYVAARRRCHIVRVNIALCFPEKSAAEQEQLVKRSMQENIVGLFESAYAWWGKPEDQYSNIDVIGLEHIQKASEAGKGVLLVGAHYSNLDLGGLLVAHCVPIDVTYRRHNNALFDYFIRSSRQRYFAHVIERSKLRVMLRGLKKGRVLWYAADQDYGRKHSVFAPFFGVEAATLNSTSKLAKMTGAEVVIVGHHRKHDGRFEVEFSPALLGFPSDSESTDAAHVNAALEQQIRKYPEQYMWVHRRFKTQRDGSKGGYYTSGKQ
ncbi:MAG: LpxL/LpxP family Kdo(2)-lipid IV(A) lauroyl/palmitoleoyl acyltransferase [Pseudomonadales bacterium]|nr:LpxL/LpxP family Kdo(2)-lipid IV(A) lauroyl/palmitoleoyl acyltransferase [Pseudomonadales bacterium]